MVLNDEVIPRLPENENKLRIISGELKRVGKNIMASEISFPVVPD
jgi:hypothetical protein